MSSDLAVAAGNCPVVVAAHRLSEWVGDEGKSITPGGALRPADVTEAARALGVPANAVVRRAADVPEVHRPWLAAIGMDLIAINGNRAARAARGSDPLSMWWAGLQALLVAEAGDIFDTDPRIVALVTLTAARDGCPPGRALRHRVHHVMDERGDWDILRSPQRHASAHPAEAALEVLELFGVVAQTGLTPLGQWAQAQLQGSVPAQITPELPAQELLAQLAGTDQVVVETKAHRWFGDRDADQLVVELVSAAAEASPAERVVAIDVIAELGEDAVAAILRTAHSIPTLAAHVRVFAYMYEQGARPDIEDLVWLATEYAHADLGYRGVAAAQYTAMEYLSTAGLGLDIDGIGRVAESGHPQAAEVSEQLSAISEMAIPVQQLKISLTKTCWRRILLPEHTTLESLHQVIRVLFGWDDDHLHVFTVGYRHYADSFHRLEETVPEQSMRLHAALPQPKATMSYTYDLGMTRRHEILLEKILDGHPYRYECVAGEGDNPAEDHDPDYPEDPKPFDIDAINKLLDDLAMAGL